MLSALNVVSFQRCLYLIYLLHPSRDIPGRGMKKKNSWCHIFPNLTYTTFHYLLEPVATIPLYPNDAELSHISGHTSSTGIFNCSPSSPKSCKHLQTIDVFRNWSLLIVLIHASHWNVPTITIPPTSGTPKMHSDRFCNLVVTLPNKCTWSAKGVQKLHRCHKS